MGEDTSQTGLAARVTGLSQSKRELLAKLLARRHQEAAAGIPRRDPSEPILLAFTQERLWILDQIAPGGAMYNMAGAAHLTGPVSIEVLMRSLNEIVRRHEILRTVYPAVDGMPRPRVLERLELVPEIVDLRSLPADQRAAQAEALMAARAVEPFDLGRGPLIRVTVVRLRDDDLYGLLVLHHIVSDGWSTKVLFREFVSLYEAFSRGREPSLPEPPIQFADFAAWQRKRVQGALLERELSYWKQMLEGSDLFLNLPTDRARPAVVGTGGALEPITLDARLTTALRGLARQHGATLFMVVLAAFAEVLGRLAGQHDVIVGTPVHSRSRSELEHLLGCFLGMLPVRLELAGDLRVAELIERVRGRVMEAMAHQDLPFEKLVDELDLARDLSHHPIYQVAFSFEDNPIAHATLAELSLSFAEIHTRTAKVDLSLELVDEGETLSGWFEYRTDLFSADLVRLIAGHLEHLLGKMALSPTQYLSAISILTEAEQHKVMVAFNRSTADFPRERCAHQLIAEQAARTPERIAVVHGERSLTYEQLDRLANRVARALGRRGVGPETFVGIGVPRSLEMVVAVLGILKAGAAYVYLDEAYPEQRLVYIVRTTGLGWVLTAGDGRLEDLLRAEGSADAVGCLPLQLDAGWLAEEDDSDPEIAVAPLNLAYGIFTSGSTGEPKGVVVHHRELVCHSYAFIDNHHMDADDRVLQFASLSFDASAATLFPPLMLGARVVVPAADGSDTSPERLLDMLVGQGVTIIHLAASLWHQWVDVLLSEGRRMTAPLKVMLTGGESPSRERLETWCGLIDDDDMIFLNAYGPTEAVITTAIFSTRCREVPSLPSAVVPAGRVLANKRLYLLDHRGQPVPVGVGGEVCVGGIGLARGYLGRPAETAAVFVPDPFSREPGARMYRTGDLARALPDGNIEFLGRIDRQVKVRGFRIELGEIEGALAEHPGVRDVAVLIRADAGGHKQIVAYLVGPAEVDPADLRAFLRDRLPAFMVPGAFVVLESMPLTARGKVDTRALPAPVTGEAAPSRQPSTPTEQALAAIWTEVLGVASPGADDDFFALGGHSLRVTQVVSRIRKELGLEVPIQRLFDFPTIATLAQSLDAQEAASRADAIPRALRTAPLPLSFSQRRLWFMSRLGDGNATIFNAPYGVRIEAGSDRGSEDAGRRGFDRHVFGRSLDAVLKRHESLRTVFVPGPDGEPVQQILDHVHIEIPLEDLREVPAARHDEEIRRFTAEQMAIPFELDEAPMFRCRLLRLGEATWFFLMVAHHIVLDGWSNGVLMRELMAFYEAEIEGRIEDGIEGRIESSEPDLPPLAVQYADFAAWQRERMAGDEAARQIEYWKQQLEGPLPVLDLPTDAPRPRTQTHRGGWLPVGFDQELTQQLKRVGDSSGATLFMVLLGAFATLLHRYTGAEDLTVGSPIANRNHADLEPLIGFFLNTLVLRVAPSPEMPFRRLLEQVRRTTLDAYANQDVPFEKLVEELQPERDLSRSPLFQVMLILQNAPMPVLRLPGVEARPQELSSGVALYDLTLVLTETASGVEGHAEYNADLFTEATVGNLLRRFTRLLREIAASPQRTLGELPLLGSVERRRIVHEWNQTKAPYERDACIHELFQRQALATPNAEAIRCHPGVGSEPLTFIELEHRANRLAHELMARGLGLGSLAGLSMDRSPDAVVSMLAVFKIGAAYIPLDPTYPRHWRELLISDAGPALILTQTRHLDELQSCGVPLLAVDDAEIEATIAARDPSPPAVRVGALDTAYVLYTSGSTGRPKGVLQTHRAAVNRYSWLWRNDPRQEGDIWAQRTSFNFIDSLWETWATLLQGVPMVIMSNEVVHDPVALVAGLAEHAVSHLIVVPSLLRAMLDTCPGLGDRVPSLRMVITSGEAIDAALAGRLVEALPRCRLINIYGTTEIADATWIEMQEHSATVPIGRPLDNLQVYVLDRGMGLVPPGVPGELFVGGDGLARGYLHRPELTAERFVPDPFGPDPGGRLYRTGDLGRIGPDGVVDYLGRSDFQVKLRGFRVELAQVEAALDQHPAVGQAVAMARIDPKAGPLLVAYLTRSGHEELELAQIMSFLRTRLPDFMVPARVVVLDRMPLTPNGKINRLALPEPSAGTLLGGASVAAAQPLNELEKQIAAIWQDVLNVETVGRSESFFDLGGHSLLMVQVQSRLKQDLDREVPMIRLFEHPTVATQAAMLSGSGDDEARPLVAEESEQKVLRGRDRLRARSARRQRQRAI